MNIDALLEDVVTNELNELKKMEVGTEEYKISVEGVTKLVDRLNEREKFGLECETSDLELKKLESENKDRFIRNCIAVAGIVIPTVVTIWGTKKSFEFEKEGTITTIMGRGFINKLLPKK